MQPLVLVVGATGQLGSVVVRKLCVRGMRVRALVREDSRVEHLKTLSVELKTGDLANADSLRAGCAGVDYVIATANAAVPRRKTDRFHSVDQDGYRRLIDAALGCHVEQFIYTSVLMTSQDRRVPLFAAKRSTEEYLAASGLPYTIIRAAAFMDVSFAMMGSDIPIAGVEAATIERPFWFTRTFFQKVRGNIARGSAMVGGDGTVRQSFVAVNDVAEYLVRAVAAPFARGRTIEVGGPEPLSPLDVVKIYEKVLGKPLRISSTPAFVFRLMHMALSPISPAAGSIMALNYLSATAEGIVPRAKETASQFGFQLTSAEQFLRQKAGAMLI